MELGKVCLRWGREKAVRAGADWCYDNELDWADDTLSPGDVADVVDGKGRFAARGFFNPGSKIAVQVLTRDENETIDRDFFRRRLEAAWAFRRSLGFENACRVVFGESDGLPGLTVDRFGDVLVAQTLSFGMDRWKDILFPLLLQALREDGQDVRAIYERNDDSLRDKEGLAQGKGFFPLPGEAVPTETVTQIVENGVKYTVDFENGQKTGFFLDQKYNRKAVARLSAGKRVLDCFTHTGSFALNAAKGGAAAVTAVDISQAAVELVAENAALNGLTEVVTPRAADIFDLLPALAAQPGKAPYDFIILDPPAFTKSRKTVPAAMRGYKELNYRAMKLLPRGGYLATCSCSHFATPELFEGMLRAAAQDAGVQLRQIESRQQSPDHPILWNVPETNYLKFYLFQVV